MYRNGLKRLFDCLLSLTAVLLLSPIYVIFALIGLVAMRGNPFFTQLRPGKNGKIFRMIKFRTMTNAKDKNGNLLPDDKRLTAYGRFLRSTSIDELPELFNILKGDMALVGPRPMLVRDLVFMSEEVRRRHTVRPGLTGLAQCSGRNAVSWEGKFEYDLRYIERVTFLGDIKILWKTAISVFQREGITEEGFATAEDYGDHLLHMGAITEEEYDKKQAEARCLIDAYLSHSGRK